MLPKPPPFSTTYNFQEVQIGIQYLQWQNKCTLQSQVCQQPLEVVTHHPADNSTHQKLRNQQKGGANNAVLVHHK